MTHRLFYHYLAHNGVRFSVTLSVEDFPIVEAMKDAPFSEMETFLKTLVNESELQHVTGPVEVEE